MGRIKDMVTEFENEKDELKDIIKLQEDKIYDLEDFVDELEDDKNELFDQIDDLKNLVDDLTCERDELYEANILLREERKEMQHVMDVCEHMLMKKSRLLKELNQKYDELTKELEDE